MMYCEEQREFYNVKQTPKTIIIEWIENLSNGKPLNHNVRWGNLKVKKDNSGRHCLKENGDRILIYPERNGQPFCLVPATREHIEREIKSCEEWGVGSKYYQDLISKL